ncbi:MAG TPA: adenylate/guanylate cyclase domain-containing protein, partial [Leptospiraceae bacterium]|nr:adenylate/guanylate cyclase domain-containing protein [Leptospiraceae bacterium]
IGISTGPLVAGIVGKKKFAYDVWGDTVNIASRMESSGESGRINISRSTYKIIKNEFICRARGKIQAKNKGKLDMYFVDGIKKKR